MAGQVTDSDDLAADADSIHDEMTNLLDKGDEGKSKDEEVDDLSPEGDEDRDDEGGEGEEKPPKGEGKEKEGEGEEEEEGEFEEEDLEEEVEGEFREGIEPPLFRALMKESPDLFKKHKELRPILFREHAFTQIFPDPRDAAAALQAVDDTRELEDEILRGHPGKVLDAIKRTDERGYRRFMNGLLPALAESDASVYAEVTQPVLSNILRRAQRIGEARGDQNLVRSVKHLAALIWPEQRGEVPAAIKPPVVDEETEARRHEIETREARYEMRVRRDFVGSVKSLGEKTLRRRIEKGLDPNKALSPFLKSSVINETMKEIQELMNEDLRFGRSMESLLARASRTGYPNEYKTRMIGTYLGRATQLIGPIRKRLLQQALGKSGGGGKPPLRREVGEGSAGGRAPVSLKGSEIDWERTSDLDIISGKAKKRGK